MFKKLVLLIVCVACMWFILALLHPGANEISELGVKRSENHGWRRKVTVDNDLIKMHPGPSKPAVIDFELNKQFSRITLMSYIDSLNEDCMKFADAGKVRFNIYLDGKLSTSTVVNHQIEKAEEFIIDLRGINRLRFEVHKEGATRCDWFRCQIISMTSSYSATAIQYCMRFLAAFLGGIAFYGLLCLRSPNSHVSVPSDNYSKLATERNILILLGAVALILYSYAFFSTYLSFDDWHVFPFKHGSPGSMKSSGRPLLHAYFYYVHGTLANEFGIQAAQVGRLLGVIYIALLAFSFFQILRYWDEKYMPLLGCGFVVTSPAMIMSATITNLAPATLGAFIAYLAHRVLWRNHAHYSKFIIRLVISIVLLSVSMFIYQLTAMFFFVFVGIEILNPKIKRIQLEDIIKVSLSYCVGCVTMVMNWVYIKFATNYFDIDTPRASAIGIKQFLDRIRIYLFDFCPDLFNIFVFDLDAMIRIAITLFILIGMFVHIKAHSENWKTSLVKYAAFLFTIVMATLPVLLGSRWFTAYRVGNVARIYLTVCFIISSFALYRYILPWPSSRKLVLASLSMLLFFTMMYTQYAGFNYLVEPQIKEYVFVKSKFTKEKLESATCVHVIRPAVGVSISSYGKPADMVGNISTVKPWVPAGMVRTILEEHYPSYANLKVDSFSAEKYKEIESDACVIDLRDIEKISIRPIHY